MAGETLEMTDAPVVEPAPAPAEETPEQIEARLQRTQQAIAGKLDVLEEQTLGSIRDTIGAVSDTVNTVQNVVADPMGAVQAAVLNPLGDVTEGVKESVTSFVQEFVPTDVIRRHPLESVGVAALGGVAVGLLLFSRPRAAAPGGPPTMFDSLLNTIGSEVSSIGRELLGSVSKTVMERVKTAVGASPTA